MAPMRTDIIVGEVFDWKVRNVFSQTVDSIARHLAETSNLQATVSRFVGFLKLVPGYPPCLLWCAYCELEYVGRPPSSSASTMVEGERPIVSAIPVPPRPVRPATAGVGRRPPRLHMELEGTLREINEGDRCLMQLVVSHCFGYRCCPSAEQCCPAPTPAAGRQSRGRGT